MDIQPRDRTPPAIYCDKEEDYGRIPVDFDSLRQWRLSRLQLARFLAKELGLEPPLLGRAQVTCRLGTLRRKKTRPSVTIEFAGEVELAVGNGRRSVWELLTLDGEQLSLDLEELANIADAAPDQRILEPRQSPSSVRELGKEATRARNERILREGRQMKRKHRWTTSRIAEELAKKIPDWKLGRSISTERVRRILSGTI